MYFYLVFFPERWEVICKNAASALIMLSHSHAEKAGPRAAWEEVSALSQEPSSLSEAVGTAPGAPAWSGGVGRAVGIPPRRGCGSLSLRPTREVTVTRRLPRPRPSVSISPTQPVAGPARNVWRSFPLGQTQASEGQNSGTSLVVQQPRLRARRAAPGSDPWSGNRMSHASTRIPRVKTTEEMPRAMPRPSAARRR